MLNIGIKKKNKRLIISDEEKNSLDDIPLRKKKIKAFEDPIKNFTIKKKVKTPP